MHALKRIKYNIVSIIFSLPVDVLQCNKRANHLIDRRHPTSSSSLSMARDARIDESRQSIASLYRDTEMRCKKKGKRSRNQRCISMVFRSRVEIGWARYDRPWHWIMVLHIALCTRTGFAALYTFNTLARIIIALESFAPFGNHLAIKIARELPSFLYSRCCWNMWACWDETWFPIARKVRFSTNRHICDASRDTHWKWSKYIFFVRTSAQKALMWKQIFIKRKLRDILEKNSLYLRFLIYKRRQRKFRIFYVLLFKFLWQRSRFF